MSLSGHVHHVALLLAYMILSFLLMLSAADPVSADLEGRDDP